jgi:hypothetical protein
MKVCTYQTLSISLISGESVWDAAVSGKKTSGIAEVIFPAGKGFYELHALPTVPEGASLPVMFILFSSPDSVHEVPSYDHIRRSLAQDCEILAEMDGTILSLSAGSSLHLPAEVIAENIYSVGISFRRSCTCRIESAGKRDPTYP